MSINTTYNLIGYLGDLITLFAYFLLQTNRIKAEQLSYALYNSIGSVLLLVALYNKPNSPAIVIEISWLIISILGIYKFFAGRKYSRVVSKTE